MFDGRQTSEKVRDKALVVAKNNGFESELNKVIKETGEGGYSAKFGVKDEIYVIEKAGDYSKVYFSAYECTVAGREIENMVEINNNNTLNGVLDLRGVDKVDLTRCDLSKVNHIIFEKMAAVYLTRATNLPTNLDVSTCDEVSMDDANIFNVKELRFKNKEQLRRSGIALTNPNDWKGKIVYTDDENITPIISRGNDRI